MPTEAITEAAGIRVAVMLTRRTQTRLNVGIRDCAYGGNGLSLIWSAVPELS